MSDYKVIMKPGPGREAARAKVDSVEKDHQLGPITIIELWSHDFTEELKSQGVELGADITHIQLEIYKYRAFVTRYDVTDVPWSLYGEYTHMVSVETSRDAIEKALKKKDTDAIVKALASRFTGPYAADKFIAFCRGTARYFSIHEDGPADCDLVRRFYKTPLGEITQAL